MTNPLEAVRDWYTSARDALRVVRRVVDAGVPNAITNRHSFYHQEDDQNRGCLDQAQTELDRIVVLALTAVFERTVRDYLAGLGVIAATTGVALHDRVRGELAKDMEFWNVSARVLDLFETVVPALRGQVKQIIAFRNWVAHGLTTSEPPPVNVTPADAFKRLTEFLTQAGVI